MIFTQKDIERGLIKSYRKDIWCRFTRAIREYDLIQDGDHIAVCISGGKDSMIMAKLFQELLRHGKKNFDLTFLSMDPGYNPENRALIQYNAKLMGIPVIFFETDIFEAVTTVEQSPCYLCARMRRGSLYSKAKSLGCNKIALGHHYDDVIETILMGMLYGGQTQTMMPKLHSTNFPGMELIRPMYLIRESSIINFARRFNLRFLRCACRFTESIEKNDGEMASKRKEVKELIATLAKKDPIIESNIFRSVEKVNLREVISYKKDGKIVSFLDDYDR